MSFVKKLTVLMLAVACLGMLAGCDEKNLPPVTDPQADMDAAYKECRPGTIADIFTEGGADKAEVIALDEDGETTYFTVMKDTEFLRYFSDTGETETIAKADLTVGDRVEIDCESYQNSDYHPIISIKVIEDAREDVILKEPPVLIVTCGGESIEALKGGYSWSWENDDGTSTSAIADSAHPLQCRDIMPCIVLNIAEKPSGDALAADLRFETVPDSVTAVCWTVDSWDKYDAESEAVPVEVVEVDMADGGYAVVSCMGLKDGDYIYEISAKWIGAENWHGSASYSFYTAKADKTTGAAAR